MSWRICQLGDVIELRYGKSLPDRDRKFGDIPVYGSGGIGGWHDIALVSGPGVIVGRKGSVGSVFYEARNFFPIDTAYYVVPKDGRIDLRYAYYLLSSLPLASMNSDVAVPGLNRDRALGLEISVPSYAIQLSISNILSTYDDLIENNRRRMALLEESARLLYREWFVRLRFPGYEHTPIVDGVPQGWERKTLGDSIILNYGKALKAEIRVEGDFPVFGSSGIVGTHEKALVQGPAIVLGRKGNVGSVYWSSKSFYPIDTVYFVTPESSSLYLFYALKNMHFISTDVAVPGLNRDFAYSRHLLHPPLSLLRSFHETVERIHAQLDKLDETNKKLRAARDLLLPRLMSGELAV
ncbi:restriction endonuclease subunit S [Rhodoferax sp. PAMC 29310]|uniref:restriction endonuclease subunit S n=1 Tax=Rhodoferax sp. PAMC 29310 TaxID=2822760 RepID=UPI001B342A61|nr:restriction endonuclease subunit S [Rhodoferax sp. PAMC 29310]